MGSEEREEVRHTLDLERDRHEHLRGLQNVDCSSCTWSRPGKVREAAGD